MRDPPERRQNTEAAPNEAPGKCPSRVWDVYPREILQCRDPHELFFAMTCALEGKYVPRFVIYQHFITCVVPPAVLAEMYAPEETAQSELHGNINPNTFIVFDHPDIGDGENSPWDTGYTVGALIYWEPPISIQTLQKRDNPDGPVQPPRPWP